MGTSMASSVTLGRSTAQCELQQGDFSLHEQTGAQGGRGPLGSGLSLCRSHSLSVCELASDTLGDTSCIEHESYSCQSFTLESPKVAKTRTGPATFTLPSPPNYPCFLMRDDTGFFWVTLKSPWSLCCPLLPHQAQVVRKKQESKVTADAIVSHLGTVSRSTLTWCWPWAQQVTTPRLHRGPT